MVYTNEPRGNRHNIIKQNFLDICDQSKVTCRANQKDQFEYKSNYFLMCSCNSIPQIPDIDEAVTRRWKCISYNQKFISDYNKEKPEPNTQQLKLESEIFSDLNGYEPYFFNLLLSCIYKEEKVPESSKTLLNELISEQNPYNDWFNECVEKTNVECNISRQDLWTSYLNYCAENSEKPACTVNKFKNEVSRLCKVGTKKTNTVVVFTNVRFKLQQASSSDKANEKCQC